MAKKKKKNKKKTLNQLKKELEAYNTSLEGSKHLAFELIKGKSEKVINDVERRERKRKKHKLRLTQEI